MKLRDSGPSWLVISILTIHQLLATVSVAGDVPKPNPAVQPGTLGSDVNPFIGTGGVTYLCGNNFPGATVPFGMVRLSPDTVSLLGQSSVQLVGLLLPGPAHPGVQPYETGGDRRHGRREFSGDPLYRGDCEIAPSRTQCARIPISRNAPSRVTTA